MKTVALIPIKLNNERLPGKNLKTFSDGEVLATFVLKKLIQIDSIDEVFVYCSDDSIQEHMPKGVKYLKRPKTLDSNETRMNEVISSFIEKVDSDIYLLTHVTSPFVSPEKYIEAIEAVKANGYDSAFIVERLQEFIWYNGRPLTYDPTSIPRTQDMEPIYKETSGAYVFTKDVAESNRRIGDSPFMVQCDGIEAIDIDNSIDFVIADAIKTFLSQGKE